MRWVRIFLNILFISSLASAIAQDDVKPCPVVNLLNNNKLDSLSTDVNGIKCNIINEEHSCISRIINEPKLRSELLSSLNQMNEQYLKQPEGEILFKKKQTDINLYEYFGDDAVLVNKLSKANLSNNMFKELAVGESVNFESPVHQFMESSKASKELFPKLRDKIINNYIKFADQFQCQNGVEVDTLSFNQNVRSDYSKSNGLKTCYSSAKEAQAYIDLKSEKINPFFKKFSTGENIIKNNVSCDEKNIVFESGPMIKAEQSCAGKFSKYFANNIWELDSNVVSQDPEYLKLKKCIDKMVDEGFEMNDVRIESSSSQLNNTKKAKEKFCSKGFKELSVARANSAKNLLENEFGFSPDKFSLDTSGDNNNGTSGVCPYKKVDGKEVLKSEFQNGGSALKDLDSAKYVKVSISFEPKGERRLENKRCFHIARKCKKLRYKCYGSKNFQPNWPKN